MTQQKEKEERDSLEIELDLEMLSSAILKQATRLSAPRDHDEFEDIQMRIRKLKLLLPKFERSLNSIDKKTLEKHDEED